MITLFHGSDRLRSREEYLNLLSSVAAEERVVLGGDFSWEKLAILIGQVGLFASIKLLAVSLENKGELQWGKKAEEVLSRFSDSLGLLFWVGEQLQATHPFLGWVKEHGRPFVFVHKDKALPFAFLDAVAARQRREALVILARLLDRGESPLLLLSLLQRQTRHLLAAQSGAKLFSQLHPYVQKKLAGAVRSASTPELLSLAHALFELEAKIKTGKINPTLGLQLLVFEFGQ